jgi:hypothetical protein
MGVLVRHPAGARSAVVVLLPSLTEAVIVMIAYPVTALAAAAAVIARRDA